MVMCLCSCEFCASDRKAITIEVLVIQGVAIKDAASWLLSCSKWSVDRHVIDWNHFCCTNQLLSSCPFFCAVAGFWKNRWRQQIRGKRKGGEMNTLLLADNVRFFDDVGTAASCKSIHIAKTFLHSDSAKYFDQFQSATSRSMCKVTVLLEDEPVPWS